MGPFVAEDIQQNPPQIIATHDSNIHREPPRILLGIVPDSDRRKSSSQYRLVADLLQIS
jgi:hypothetical protein